MITMDRGVCRLCGNLALIIDVREVASLLHTLTQRHTARIQQRAQARTQSYCLQRSGRPVPGWNAFAAAALRARSTVVRSMFEFALASRSASAKKSGAISTVHLNIIFVLESENGVEKLPR